MSADDALKQEIRNAVRAARARGARSFSDVLALCEGADPRLVASVCAEAPAIDEHPAAARRETSELAALFPAADPVACQWWFTLDTVERLANRVYQAAPPNAHVAFLGAPTVGYQYSRRGAPATVFDVDPHVIAALRATGGLTALAYDVANPIPAEHVGKYGVVLIDPPWYSETVLAFLDRALALASPYAAIFCSLPPRLTRPGILDERQALLQRLRDADIDVVALERSATRYLVPEFERVVHQDLPDFDGRPWRSGDLLHLHRREAHKFVATTIPPYETVAFARNPKRYRVFLRRQPRTRDDLPTWIARNRDFEHTVSRRKVDPSTLDWWSTDKRGGCLRNGDLVERALDHWANGPFSREETQAKLIEAGVKTDDARTVCQDLDAELGLWADHGSGTVIPRPTLATRHATGRPYKKADDDGFRGPFQRDRDRITWSRGLRQLANKTQVFPLGSGDYLRNRLSHSLEVMQLATTIGTSFSLDLNLIEAGALAHDIGHTPFGHAGEYALDKLFSEIREALGFNHYEHGVDVVRWLEDAYQSPAFGGLYGLNVTSEVAECIFKHTYCQSGRRFCQKDIYKYSKHKSYFSDDLSHLEGQAVRIADKVSYLISDLEDGIRVGALTLEDLLSCRLLRRPPIDLVPTPGESAHERFLSQRSLLIGIVMEDIIEATARRLSTVTSVAEVRRSARYTVDHSDELSEEVGEIWERLQKGKLHKDARVRVANFRAGRIVRELTLLFAVAPELVDQAFRDSHRRLHRTEYLDFYRKHTGAKVTINQAQFEFLVRDGGSALGLDTSRDPEVPVEDLIQAKDFVAGLSDVRAQSLHHTLLAI